MERNQKCVVSDNAPQHAGRVGYFQFFGQGPSQGTAVLAAHPVKQGYACIMFAVSSEHCLPER